MQKVITNNRFCHVQRVRRSVRYLIGLLAAVVGIARMQSVILPRMDWSDALGAWPIISHRVNAQAFTVVVGFFLIMLSYGLARGKKHAWRLTLILLVISAVLDVQRHGSVLGTILVLLFAIVLWTLASFFQAKSDPPSAWRGYAALGLGLGVVIFYTIGGFFTLDDSFGPLFDRFGIDTVIIHVLTFTHIHFLTHSMQAFFFSRALPLLCISVIVYGMLQLYRPIAAVLMPDIAERLRVAKLVHLHGTNSISYFAMDDDKSYFFSEEGQSVISYVLKGSTAIVAGDPIGPEEDTAAAIQQFINFCNEQDWTIVFWQVRDTTANLYRQAGLHLLKIGEDAIIDVQNFTLKGGAMANVRSSAKRAEKDGLHVIFYRGQVKDSEQLMQMEHISRRWLASKGGNEMGFSMGRFSSQGDLRQLYGLAVDGHNKVHAFVSFIPIYGRHGWGLDLMRRAEVCAPGTMELLLARSIEHMKMLGTETASLGLAPMSNANEEDSSFLWTQIDSLNDRFGNPEQGRSLFNFKKKFQPCWESRYLVYSDALNLPKIGWAVYHAHQSDATLVRTMRQYLREWQQSRLTDRAQAATVETARG
ncbi:MAG TPA: phosphatidylglycerol lysyltransferase domain-containing protein [Ktedonobacteraceae bacterium]|nr:phosphatidylglycerol lysyltransferase domain-containing protein [Ktedonobacteraceae bacterium]